jgi:hypothetical protein
MHNATYAIDLQAPAGMKSIIEVYLNFPEIKNIENGRLINLEGNTARIEVIFEGEEKYIGKQVRIKVEKMHKAGPNSLIRQNAFHNLN